MPSYLGPGSIPGSDKSFLILYCLKKPVKERIHLM